MSEIDSAPYVCPGCHAVGGERCAPDCIDAAIEAELERCRNGDGELDQDFCGVCGGDRLDVGSAGCTCSDDYDGWTDRDNRS